MCYDEKNHRFQMKERYTERQKDTERDRAMHRETEECKGREIHKED